MKKLLKVLLVLVIVGGAGYYGYQYYRSTQGEAVADAPAYSQAVVSKGNLSKTVSGTGTLSIGETQDVSLSYGVTITGALVEAGDVVEAGQPLLTIDKDALQTTIDTLQEELDTCETDLSTASSSHSSTKTVYMPLDGRVKEIYLEEGRQIEDIMDEKGAIALLSLDGWMYVEVDAPEGMTVTNTVQVKVSRSTVPGTVRMLENGKAKITFADTHVGEGEEVEVLYGGESIGTYPAYINLPYYLTTSDTGYIYSIFMEENKKKWEGNRIYYLINVPVSTEYTVLQNTRTKLSAQIAEAKAMLSAGTVNSPIDGIVSSIGEASTEEQVAYTSLGSLYVGDKKQMVVSVDELDITSVQTGQNVEISMDAITDKVYSATVGHVSQIGTSESGVTVYDVTLHIDGDDQLKIGMNGTATIKIEEVQDVLLVPISAMNTSREGQYVWLYDEAQAAESDEPGIRTLITTGLSDENYAQVLTGLEEGDIVMITREASTDGTSFPMNMGGGMVMEMGTMTMPSGGMSMPSGGGAPSGGGGSRQGGGM